MHFPAQLTRELSDDGRSRNEQAKAFGISPSNLSQFCSGGEVCGARQLAKILTKMPAPARDRLAAAWLRDRIPDEVPPGNISILVNSEAGADQTQLPEMDPELSEMVNYLLNRAVRHPEVRGAILGFGRALKG